MKPVEIFSSRMGIDQFPKFCLGSSFEYPVCEVQCMVEYTQRNIFRCSPTNYLKSLENAN